MPTFMLAVVKVFHILLDQSHPPCTIMSNARQQHYDHGLQYTPATHHNHKHVSSNTLKVLSLRMTDPQCGRARPVARM